jgi:hypothetical protein
VIPTQCLSVTRVGDFLFEGRFPASQGDPSCLNGVHGAFSHWSSTALFHAKKNFAFRWIASETFK